jgi:aspartyl/asparaginyl beta-hydroxylase (cupin superfamily)
MKNILHDSITEFLEKNFEVISNEYFNAKVSLGYFEFEKEDSNNTVYHSNWRFSPISLMGQHLPELEAVLPKTLSLLRDIKAFQAIFSRLEPNTTIEEHSDGDFGKYTTRYHLCLDIEGEDAYLEVEGDRIYWQKGKSFGFNNELLHLANNNTDSERVVLIVDIPNGREMPPSYIQNRIENIKNKLS